MLAEPEQFDDPEQKERIRKTKRNDNLGAAVILIIGAFAFEYIGIPLSIIAVIIVPSLLWTLASASRYMGYSYVE